MAIVQYLPVLVILMVGTVLAVATNKLTTPAGMIGAFLGLLIFLAGGYAGIAMLAMFFALGTMATSWKLNQKAHLGLAETDKGRRSVGEVVANAGVPAILGLVGLAFPPHTSLMQVMIAASFASATADTLSSELGNVYGTRFFNILTLKKDTRGLNGVVSIEGTLIGIAGSAIIAIVYYVAYGLFTHLWIIIVAGTVGNISDSLLGATLERSGHLNNNRVNFLNTAIAACCCLIILCSI